MKIAIKRYASISSLGIEKEDILNNYKSKNNLFTQIDNSNIFISEIKNKSFINDLKIENNKYKHLDTTTLYSIFTARNLMKTYNNNSKTGVNIGSSRGATNTWESSYDYYLKNKKTLPSTSPTTTLGNISSWISQDLNLDGISFSHSITCSTAAHSILNAIVWIKSGETDTFICGGVEAANTDFTISQFKAIKIYSKTEECRAFDINKTTNSMILGEGASLFLLSKNVELNDLIIKDYGYFQEKINSSTSISNDGKAIFESMKIACKNIDLEEIDVIITHSPGTINGDKSEYNAIKKLFTSKLPLITNNKWKIGHTLGASAAFSVEMACIMIENNIFFDNPYYENITNNKNKKINNILVNSIGFGGNSVSLLISKNI